MAEEYFVVQWLGDMCPRKVIDESAEKKELSDWADMVLLEKSPADLEAQKDFWMFRNEHKRLYIYVTTVRPCGLSGTKVQNTARLRMGCCQTKYDTSKVFDRW